METINSKCPVCRRTKYPLCYNNNIGVFGKGKCGCKGNQCVGCCSTVLGMAEDFA